MNTTIIIIYLIIFSIFRLNLTFITNMNDRKQHQSPNNTIILIPGVGGSILYGKNIKTSEEKRLWVVYFNQDENALLLENVHDNQTNKLIDDGYQIYTKNDWFGLHSIYNLNPDLLIHEYTEYYAHMIDFLIEIGYDPGKNLFGFPFDWRYSNNY